MESHSHKYVLHCILKMRLSGPDSPHLIYTSSASLTDMNLHKFRKTLNLRLCISSLLRDDLQTIFLLFHVVYCDYGTEFRVGFEKSKEYVACQPDLVHSWGSSAATTS